MTTPQLPPLFRPDQVSSASDPFERACALAVSGADPGIVVYSISEYWLRASIVFAPDVPLAEAMAVLPACGVGFQNALGSLAPPEVSVHLEWGGAIRVNGARCGRFRVAASSHDPAVEPEWLVLGLELVLNHSDASPGDNPDETALIEEGCVEVEPVHLLEAWVRHTLYWINRMSDEGIRPLQAEWRGLAHNLGKDEELLGEHGLFVGVDDNFGALMRTGDNTRLIPLSRLLEN